MTGWRKRQVMEMAREAGGGPTPPDFLIPVFERFAELVRADEREACAKLAEKFEPDEKTSYVTYASTAIRARGQA